MKTLSSKCKQNRMQLIFKNEYELKQETYKRKNKFW